MNEADDSQNSVHLLDMPDDLQFETDSNWKSVMELRGKAQKALEDAKASDGISNPLDTGIVANLEASLAQVLKPFEPELADLCGVSRFEIKESGTTQIDVIDLSDEPRCERSWKRDGTVKERSDGGFLSDRDAEALGLS